MISANGDWHKLYGEGWTGLIVPEAFAHPAKYSRALIRHIYQHLIDEGWLEPGATVIDPFAGVALGALHAMKHRLNWVGVELEQKFVNLGQQNIDLWNSRFSQLPGWGRAVILQGDSRRLAEVVGEASGCVSSPPYIESLRSGKSGIDLSKTKREGDISHQSLGHLTHGTSYGTDPRNLGNMPEGEFDGVVASPPYVGSDPSASHVQGHSRLDPDSPNYRPFAERSIAAGYNEAREYGPSEGQLANMPAGELDACVASPPYSKGIINPSGISESDRQHRTNIGRDPDSPGSHGVRTGYGDTDGQLAALPEGEFAEACVSSPPWAGNSGGMGEASENAIDSALFKRHLGSMVGAMETDGNLGNEQGNTFWSAARQIVQQVYQVLAPGAPAVWVVKSFVRSGKRVDFPDQWRKLCESVGFETVHLHRAWLVEDRGSQFDLFGKVQENRVERKSFFRRLHEYHASAKMYWEQHVTDRDARTRYMWDAHRELWESYRFELANPKKDLPPPTPPIRSKIVANARVLAYKGAEEPWMDIDTRIDWEVVLCQRKPQQQPLFAGAGAEK